MSIVRSGKKSAGSATTKKASTSSKKQKKDIVECLSSSSTLVLEKPSRRLQASSCSKRQIKQLAPSTISVELQSQMSQVIIAGFEEESEEHRQNLCQLESQTDPIATLHEIAGDVKTGVPSVQEERMKQEKILRKRQLQLKNVDDEAVSAAAAVEESAESSQQCSSAQTVNEKPRQPVRIVNGIPVQELEQKRVSSLTFSEKKATHTRKWTDAETTKFYKSLQIFGTDFSLISKLFPNRDRMQIKVYQFEGVCFMLQYSINQNKFRKEERENSIIVEHQLKLNSKGRFTKVQARLAEKKRQMTSTEIDASHSIPIKQRVEQLLQQRKKRLLSFESVDAADIEIAEEFNDIFEMQKRAIEGNNSNNHESL